MTCAHCRVVSAENERLAGEVAALRRELEASYRDRGLAAIVARLGLTPSQARITLRLYEAGGKPVSHEILERELLYTPSRVGLRVLISQARQRLERDIYLAVPSVGYALTVPGVSMVMCALHPPELQDARG